MSSSNQLLQELGQRDTLGVTKSNLTLVDIISKETKTLQKKWMGKKFPYKNYKKKGNQEMDESKEEEGKKLEIKTEER